MRYLDFGCGLWHLYEYISRESLASIGYSGLDISPRFLELSRQKFPEVTYSRSTSWRTIPLCRSSITSS